LVAVSHIDADHIDGVLRLLNVMRDKIEGGYAAPYLIDRFWHNSLDDLVLGGAPHPHGEFGARFQGELSGTVAGIAAGQSVAQGREARQLANYLSLHRNPPVGSVLDSSVGNVDVEGLSISIVGPRRSELEAQWVEWRRAVDRADARAAAAAYTDPNVYNQASIVLLIEYDGARLLLTGDARGDHLLQGLDEAGLLDEGRLHVDLLKVPHHGSKANAEPDLFEAVTADHYVISACGTHGHPHHEVLDWIADSRHGKGFTLHLTNTITHPYDVVAHINSRPDRSSFNVNVRAPGQTAVRITLR
jgi:hypothetical protein